VRGGGGASPQAGYTRRGERITGVGVGCGDDRLLGGGASDMEGCRVEGAVESEARRERGGGERERQGIAH